MSLILFFKCCAFSLTISQQYKMATILIQLFGGALNLNSNTAQNDCLFDHANRMDEPTLIINQSNSDIFYPTNTLLNQYGRLQ